MSAHSQSLRGSSTDIQKSFSNSFILQIYITKSDDTIYRSSLITVRRHVIVLNGATEQEPVFVS